MIQLDDDTVIEDLFTKKGWARYVKEVAALEDAAADGNTWGPDEDAAILARLVIAGLRKPRRTRSSGNGYIDWLGNHPANKEVNHS